ncbi:MAG: flavoprotein [bacterium]
MNKKILLGVTGGIALYKSCDLISKLQREEVAIKVVMTRAATHFISPLTFAALSTNRVYTDLFSAGDEYTTAHISLAKWCDIFIIAPATANIIGKIANGIADDLLSSVCLAMPQHVPFLIAPSMNNNMWHNPIVQRNIASLMATKEEGIDRYQIIKPRITRLACGDIAEGAMADIEVIIETIKSVS